MSYSHTTSNKYLRNWFPNCLIANHVELWILLTRLDRCTFNLFAPIRVELIRSLCGDYCPHSQQENIMLYLFTRIYDYLPLDWSSQNFVASYGCRCLIYRNKSAVKRADRRICQYFRRRFSQRRWLLPYRCLTACAYCDALTKSHSLAGDITVWNVWLKVTIQYLLEAKPISRSMSWFHYWHCRKSAHKIWLRIHSVSLYGALCYIPTP